MQKIINIDQQSDIKFKPIPTINSSNQPTLFYPADIIKLEIDGQIQSFNDYNTSGLSYKTKTLIEMIYGGTIPYKSLIFFYGVDEKGDTHLYKCSKQYLTSVTNNTIFYEAYWDSNYEEFIPTKLEANMFIHKQVIDDAVVNTPVTINWKRPADGFTEESKETYTRWINDMKLKNDVEVYFNSFNILDHTSKLSELYPNFLSLLTREDKIEMAIKDEAN